MKFCVIGYLAGSQLFSPVQTTRLALLPPLQHHIFQEKQAGQNRLGWSVVGFQQVGYVKADAVKLIRIKQVFRVVRFAGKPFTAPHFQAGKQTVVFGAWRDTLQNGAKRRRPNQDSSQYPPPS